MLLLYSIDKYDNDHVPTAKQFPNCSWSSSLSHEAVIKVKINKNADNVKEVFFILIFFYGQ